jgi:hypothetical protein
MQAESAPVMVRVASQPVGVQAVVIRLRPVQEVVVPLLFWVVSRSAVS